VVFVSESIVLKSTWLDFSSYDILLKNFVIGSAKLVPLHRLKDCTYDRSHYMIFIFNRSPISSENNWQLDGYHLYSTDLPLVVKTIGSWTDTKVNYINKIIGCYAAQQASGSVGNIWTFK
jgi:hypothetical protein